MIRILVTSDNHLGRHYARMSVAALARRREYLRQGFLAACRRALEWPADVFLMTGDLFDQTAPRNVDRTIVARWLRKIKEAGIPALAVAGNHDSPRSQTEEGGYPAVEVYQAAGLLHVFPELGREAPEAQARMIPVREHTLAVQGFSPSAELRPGEDPLGHFEPALPPADLRVLLGHFLIENWVHPDAAESEPMVRRASLEALRGVDLVIAGDIHQFHQSRFGGVQVLVPGASERVDFGTLEAIEPGYIELTWQPERLEIRHVPIAPQPRALIELGAPDLGQTDPTGRVVTAIEREIKEKGSDVLVLVRLSGTVELEVYQALNLVEVEERLRGRLSHIDFEVSALRPRRAQGPTQPRGPHRTLAEEIRLAASQVTEDLTSGDQAALNDVTIQILALLSAEGGANK